MIAVKPLYSSYHLIHTIIVQIVNLRKKMYIPSLMTQSICRDKQLYQMFNGINLWKTRYVNVEK